MNWLLKYKPELYAFEIQRENTLIGYLLLRKRHNQGADSHKLPEMEEGTLLDYFLKDDTKEIKREMIQFAIEFFKARGVDVLEVQSIDNNFFKICADFGMIHLGGNRTFLRLAQDAKSASKSDWFFSQGTADSIL